MKWWSNIIPFNWFFIKIKESMVDHLGKSSATRINGYILTALLCMAVLVSLGIEIASAISAYKSTTIVTYSISGQLIALIGLLMGQQALLFQLKRKSEETPFPTLEKMSKNNNIKTYEGSKDLDEDEDNLDEDEDEDGIYDEDGKIIE